MDKANHTIQAAIAKAIDPLQAKGFAIGYSVKEAVEITFKWGVTHETYRVTADSCKLIDCSDAGSFYPEDQNPIRQACATIQAALKHKKEESPVMDYQEARSLAYQTTSIAYSTLTAIKAKEEEIRTTQREVGEWSKKISLEELNIPVTGSNEAERKANKAKALAESTTIQSLTASKYEAEKRVGVLTSELHELYRKHRLEAKEIDLVIALLNAKSGIAGDPEQITTPAPETAPAAVELF